MPDSGRAAYTKAHNRRQNHKFLIYSTTSRLPCYADDDAMPGYYLLTRGWKEVHVHPTTGTCTGFWHSTPGLGGFVYTMRPIWCLGLFASPAS